MNQECDTSGCSERATSSVNFMGFLNFYCDSHRESAEQERVEFLHRRALRAVRNR